MLSDREMLILKLLEKGKTRKQISLQLGLSITRIAHLSADAKRKQRLPPESYARAISNRTAQFLHSTCGPDEVPPPQIREWLLDGTLRLYGHSLLMFKGIKTRNAGRAVFLELCDYAGIDAAKLRRLKRSKVLLPSETMSNKSIARLKGAGYKITPVEAANSDHQPQRVKSEGASPYIVYANKEEEPGAKPASRRFSTMDDAARACISLGEHGYRILGVILPGGNYVTGPQIERAITMGVSTVKLALAR
jgi:hypothetical protein